MHEFLVHIFMVPLTAGTILSLRSFWQGWPLPYKTFSVLLILYLVTESFGFAWKYWLHETAYWNFNTGNYWLYNFSLIPQYLLLLRFFQQITRNRQIVKAIDFLYPVFIVFAAIDLFLLEGVLNFNRIMFAFASLIMVLLCVNYFNQLKKEEPVANLGKHPMVWLVMGIFLYHATKFPFLLGIQYLSKHSNDLATGAYHIYLAMGCFFYILFFIAYLCKPPQPK